MTLSRVVIDKRVLEAFKRRALKAYPNEHIEALCGKVSGCVAEVYSLMPMTILKAGPDYVEYELPCEEEAAGDRHKPIGSLHTHPNTNCHPSTTDWHSFNDAADEAVPETIMGVCMIERRHRRRFTSFSFHSHDKTLELVIAE